MGTPAARILMRSEALSTAAICWAVVHLEDP